MSSSGATRGGASLAQGTAAARPGTPASNFYFATDTLEISVANAGLTAWQAIGQTAAAGGFTGVNGLKSGAGSNVQVGSGGLLFFTTGNFGIASSATGPAMQVPAIIDATLVGVGVAVKEGTNAKQGTTGVMSAGAVTVTNTAVTASSRILVCRSPGGTNAGAWYVSAQTAGTSFVVTSTNAADTGNGVFFILEPG